MITKIVGYGIIPGLGALGLSLIGCATVSTDYPAGTGMDQAGNGGAAGTQAGGSRAVSGGMTSTGGVVGAGGARPSGGRSSGGMTGTGGSSGGTVTAGGSAATGGSQTGGSTATGGIGAGGVGSACEAGFVFCDDFEDGNDNGWTQSGGTWIVTTDAADGGTNHAYQGGDGSQEALASPTGGLSDQSVEAAIKVMTFGGTGSSYRAGIIARYTDPSTFYTFSVDQAGALTLRKSTSSPSSTSGICDTQQPGVNPLIWNTYKMVVQGAPGNVHITTYFNGTLMHDCTTTTSSAPAAGSAGLLTYGSGTVALFDDFRVSSP